MSDGLGTVRDRPRQRGVRTGVVASLVAYAMLRGVSMERICARTGLTPAALSEVDGWLPEACMPVLWRLLAEACPGEAFELQMAEMTPAELLGPVRYLARHSADVRGSILASIPRAFVITGNLQMELVEARREASLRFHHPLDVEEGGFGVRLALALAARLLQEIAGPGSLVRVELSLPTSGPLAAYEEFFGVPVLFPRPAHALVLHRHRLSLPTAQPDPTLVRILQGHLDVVRERAAALGQDDELARIQAAVATNAAHAEYGAVALAKRLGMSLRALQRTTRAHHTTVHALLEEAREARARQLVCTRGLGIAEIASRVGFSDERAFRRAFLRWTKRTPAAFRRDAVGP